MRKNVAGQIVCAQLPSRTDGSDVTTGTTTVHVTIDGIQAAGTGTVAHEGNGQWSYLPTQAETNGTHLAFTFVNALAVSQCVNVYTVSFDPHGNLPTQVKGIDDNALTAAAIAADAVTKLQTGLATLTLAQVKTIVYGAVACIARGDVAAVDAQYPEARTSINAGGGEQFDPATMALSEALTDEQIADAVAVEVERTGGLLKLARDDVALLVAMTEVVSLVRRWRADALSQAPAGGGGEGVFNYRSDGTEVRTG